MNKELVHLNRKTNEYLIGRRAFISNALDVAAFEGKIKCPCRRCCNMFYRDPFEVDQHLYVEGMDPHYIDIPWVEHGEHVHTSDNISSPTTKALNERSPENFMAAMLHDVFSNHVHMDESDHVGESFSACDETSDAHQFDNILREADEELYPGSKKKKLDFVVKLYQSKLLYGMSDVAFGSVLALIREHFPMCETLPPNLYYTKKIIRALRLDYQNIDACQNNCMLFWKEHVNAIVCAKCGASRYKQKKGNSGTIQCTKVPKKVLCYFPIGPRLQRLYMSLYTVESMIWHSDIRTDDGVLRHPADSLAWKHLDNTYPDFARECRNVRLGLASDGFNPFGMHGKHHSTWPILVVVYNLPPWMCMKQPYIMMSLLIPGKTSPGDAIDVFLQPLIDDLRHLWTPGLRTYDNHRHETFTMRAALLWTINDFPAYAMLSGSSTSGEKACLTCGDDTDSLRLKHGKKFAFMGHRRWFPMSHRYRRHKKFLTDLKNFDTPLNQEVPWIVYWK